MCFADHDLSSIFIYKNTFDLEHLRLLENAPKHIKGTHQQAETAAHLLELKSKSSPNKISVELTFQLNRISYHFIVQSLSPQTIHIPSRCGFFFQFHVMVCNRLIQWVWA